MIDFKFDIRNPLEMGKMFVAIFMIVEKVECSVNYLDNIFDNLFELKLPEITFNSFEISFDVNNPEVLFESRQEDYIYEPTAEDLKDYEKFLDELNPAQIKKNLYDSDKNNVDDDLVSNYSNINFELDEYMESFYYKLHSFINQYVFNSFRNTYIKRLDKIKLMTKLICKNKNSEINMTIFDLEIENGCMHMIKNLFEKYKPHINFTTDIYNIFSREIDETIDCFLSVKFIEYEVLTYNNIQERPYILVNEYMEIYKYITYIPEILSLGYVLVPKPSVKIIIILHLLKLFITRNEETIQRKRIFILFLIIKALSCTSKNSANFIEALKLQENFMCYHPELHSFVWEFKFSQRVTFKNRINVNKNQSFILNQKDLFYYNLIQRIFMFQHLLFLKFYDFNYKHYEELIIFYEETMKSKGCYGCQFNQFMNIARNHFKIK